MLGDSAENPRFVETLPRRGYRFIAPVDGVREVAISAAVSDAPGQVPRKNRNFSLPIIVFGVSVLLVAAAWYAFIQQRAGKSHVQRPLMRVTFDEGLQTDPTWSPDGRFIAFTSDRGGKLDIWVQQVSGGDPVQVTHSAGNNYQSDWSPDGKSIAYRSEEAGGGLFVIPAWAGQGLEKKDSVFWLPPTLVAGRLADPVPNPFHRNGV